MNKKGFTIIELAIILLVLLVVGLIFFLSMKGIFDKFKDRAFKTDAKELYKIAQQNLLNDKMFTEGSNKSIVYSKSKNEVCKKQLSLNNKRFTDDFEYYIEYDEQGKIVKFYVTNGLYQYGSDKKDLKAADIDEIQLLSDLDSEDIYKINCDYVETNKESCVDTLITDRGSFSSTETVKSICIELNHDSYTYTNIEYDEYSEEKKNNNDTLIAKVTLGDMNNEFKVYDKTNKRKEIVTVSSDDYPQSRYSINNGLLVSSDTISVVIGKYDKDKIEIEASSGVDYELFYVSKYTTEKYSGPWIRNQKTINKVKNLFAYNLTGFTNCDENNKCEEHKYIAVFNDDKAVTKNDDNLKTLKSTN